jgi:hypothetical protein
MRNGPGVKRMVHPGPSASCGKAYPARLVARGAAPNHSPLAGRRTLWSERSYLFHDQPSFADGPFIHNPTRTRPTQRFSNRWPVRDSNPRFAE